MFVAANGLNQVGRAVDPEQPESGTEDERHVGVSGLDTQAADQEIADIDECFGEQVIGGVSEACGT